MAYTATVEAGKSFSAGEKVTYSGLNLLGLPTITITGALSADEIPAGIITEVKLADEAVTQIKLKDRLINLAKLELGDPGTLLYWDAGGEPQRLSPGNAGDKLVIENVGGKLLPRWAAPSEIADIEVSQITAGSEGYHLVSRSGTSVWEAQPTIPTLSLAWTSHTTHFNEKLYSDGSFTVAGTETPTVETAPSDGLDGGGAQPVDTLDTWSAGLWGTSAYKYADFTINQTKIETALGSTISSFDSDVSELLIYAQLKIDSDGANVAAALYFDSNLSTWVPLALIGQGTTANTAGQATQVQATVPRTETGQIKLRLLLDTSAGLSTGFSAFKILAHR